MKHNAKIAIRINDGFMVREMNGVISIRIGGMRIPIKPRIGRVSVPLKIAILCSNSKTM